MGGYTHHHRTAQIAEFQISGVYIGTSDMSLVTMDIIVRVITSHHDYCCHIDYINSPLCTGWSG